MYGRAGKMGGRERGRRQTRSRYGSRRRRRKAGTKKMWRARGGSKLLALLRCSIEPFKIMSWRCERVGLKYFRTKAMMAIPAGTQIKSTLIIKITPGLCATGARPQWNSPRESSQAHCDGAKPEAYTCTSGIHRTGNDSDNQNPSQPTQAVGRLELQIGGLVAAMRGVCDSTVRHNTRTSITMPHAGCGAFSLTVTEALVRVAACRGKGARGSESKARSAGHEHRIGNGDGCCESDLRDERLRGSVGGVDAVAVQELVVIDQITHHCLPRPAIDVVRRAHESRACDDCTMD